MLPVGHPLCSCSSGHLPGNYSLLIRTSQGSNREPYKPSEEAVSGMWVTGAASCSAETPVWGVFLLIYLQCAQHYKKLGAIPTQGLRPLSLFKSEASTSPLLLLSHNFFTFCRRPMMTQGTSIQGTQLGKKLN